MLEPAKVGFHFFTEMVSISMAVFVERLLRIQPDVKKVFVLVRAADTAGSAARRVHEEVRAGAFFYLDNS